MTNRFKSIFTRPKQRLALSIFLATALLFTGCSANLSSSTVVASAVETTQSTTATATTLETPTLKAFDTLTTYSDKASVAVVFNGTQATIKSATSGVTYKNGVLSITKSGTYVLSGTLNNGQIIVNATKNDKVHLVLKNLTLNSQNGPALWIKQADKVTLTLANGSVNTLTDSTQNTQVDADNEPDATLFSKDDLSINGNGSLIVKGNYASGIRSKDDLTIVSGNININAKTHGLVGSDSLAIFGGKLNVISGEDALHSKTQVYYKAGDATLSAGDDGVHADQALSILGGKINIIKSYEGLESAHVSILGGTINLVASDDGINAAGGNDGTSQANDRGNESTTNTDYFIKISGGTLHVNASGDGLDANGSLYITGGNTTVSGPTNDGNGALDYDAVGIISGGTLVASGSSGMAQMPQDTSTQASMIVYFDQTQNAGTQLSLKDTAGKTLITYRADKAFTSVVMSAPTLKKGSSYQLYANDKLLTTLKLTAVANAFNQDGSTATVPTGFGAPGMGHGGQKPPQDGTQSPPQSPPQTTDGNSSATKK